MSSFLITALVIMFATIIALIWPLIRSYERISYERKEQNIHFAKERLSELEQQLSIGAISQFDYDGLKQEIENTLAEDIDIAQASQQAVQAATPGSNTLLIILLCVIVPLTASLIYLATGNPNAILVQEQAKQRPTADDIDTLISGVEQRLQENPEDIRGWEILSRTYSTLGRHKKARDAYLNLIALQGETADLLAALAQASSMMVGGELAGEPAQYAERALLLEPEHPQALWLVGLNATQQGNNELAVELWTRLLPMLNQAPQQQQELQQAINELLPQTSNKIAQITVEVSMDAKIANISTPEDTVFVIALAQSGPSAPLAVKRLMVKDLPATVTLNDNDAMIPQFRLSSFAGVNITARVSKSGQPIAQSGDIQSAIIASRNNNPDTINLTISDILE